MCIKHLYVSAYNWPVPKGNSQYQYGFLVASNRDELKFKQTKITKGYAVPQDLICGTRGATGE